MRRRLIPITIALTILAVGAVAAPAQAKRTIDDPVSVSNLHKTVDTPSSIQEHLTRPSTGYVLMPHRRTVVAP